MPNNIVTAGVLSKSYISRALITHNFDNKVTVRSTNGMLWALFRENIIINPVVLYLSMDDGFSWRKVWNGNLTSSTNRRASQANLNTNGHHLRLQLFEHLNRLVIWHPYYNIAANRYDVEPFILDISTPTIPLEVTSATLTEIILDADQLAIEAPYTEKTVYLSYLNFNNFRVKQYRPLYQTAVESTSTHSGSYFNIFAGVAHKDGYCDYAILANTGTGAYKIVHFRYTEATQTFSTDHNVSVFAGAYDATDISIARDGNNNLLVAWGRYSTNGADMDVYYAVSTNNGVTWGTTTIINKSAGHSVYIDAISGQKSTRTTVLGGLSGFLIGYTRSNTNNVPKTYVRTISSDGTTVGEEKEIGTRVARTADAVVGLRWFQPSGCNLLDLTDPGLVRVAFQVGEGNSALFNDTKPVRICQELLRSSAYPLTTARDGLSYSTDLPGDNQLQITVNIIGGPSENIDYYAAGLTGPITDRHIGAFKKVGIEGRLFKYEPSATSEMDDRSAYSSPTAYSTLMVLDPNTYEAPLANSSEQFNTFIERDIRKIYLPPDFHLDRTYIINNGNFLKRTVWTVYFDGNEYELSQVVPYFLKSQIAYYSANAYVIGPSNNPFAKNTLPSET